MIVGTAQVDVTPRPGIELSGFAVRRQPSTGVLDSLAARALYLEDGPERLLWLHADVLAIEDALADQLRRGVEETLGIPAPRVLVSATHTHSAPPTVHLTGCGRRDADYVTRLKNRLLSAARSAMGNLEECALSTVAGRCDLAIDRRAGSAHVDRRVAAVGLRRSDGTFKAVLLNYAMHGVCLRGTEISADWPGAVARRLTLLLPGRPNALVFSGACGNLNPPAVGVSNEEMRQWSRQVADSVLPALASAPTGGSPGNPRFHVAGLRVPLPMEDWTATRINAHADRRVADPAGCREFGETFRSAVETWRATMLAGVSGDKAPGHCAELAAVALGPVTFVTVNAEVFSQFNELIAGGGRHSVHAIGCTNGMMGYLPTRAAYDEGGYEVEEAMLFYNMPRPGPGSLEYLAQRARRLVEEVA